jgi:PAS domain S-box-containing protein
LRNALVTLALFGCLTGVFALVAERLALVDVVLGYYALALVLRLILDRRAAILLLLLAPAGVAGLALTNRTGAPLTDTDDYVRVTLLAAFAAGMVYAISRWLRRTGEYRRVEGALRTSEERFRYLFERSPLPMMVVDFERFTFVEVNEVAVRKYGYSRERFLSMRVLDLRRAEDVPRLEERLAEARAAHPEGIWQQSDSARHVLADGSTIDVEISSTVTTFQGRRALLIVANDVTARNRAAAALRDSELRYRALIDHAADGIIITDLSTVCLEANTRICTMLGYAPGELVGVQTRDFILGGGEHPLPQQLEAILAGETARSERLVRRKDGSTMWVEISARRIDEGRLQGIVRDISDRKRAEEMVAARSRQQEALAELGRVALADGSVQGLLDRAVALVAEVLDVEYAEALELQRGSAELLLRAGAGWGRDLLGARAAGSDREHEAGYALISEAPVIVDDVASETRFAESPLFAGHGIKSGLSFAIRGRDEPWGVVGAHTTTRRLFSADDAHFLRGVADVLAASIARHRAYDELTENQRFLATLISNLPGYAYRCKNDADHTLEFISEGVAPLTGYAAASFLAQRTVSLHEIIHPDDHVVVHAAMDEGLRNQRAWNTTYRLRTRTGEDRWVHEQGRGVYGPEGNLLAREGFVTDITEQHRAEDDLRESERRLRTIIEHAPEAMVIFDVERWRFVDVNENAVALFGYPREVLLGLDASALSPPVQPDGRPSVEFGRAFVNEAAAGRLPVFEWTHRNAAGEDIPCEVRLVGLPSTERTLVRASITDIRERKRLEEQFLQAQKMESIGRLAGGVAHDFNNMMTATIGYADLALASLPADGPVADDLREIRQTAQRAADLSHQLLAFSRRQMIEPRVVSLNELVARTDRILGRLIGEDIHLVTSTAPDLGLVKIDPGQFEQVLINLVVNARDALPGGGEITIQTSNVDLGEEDAAEHDGVKPGPYVMLAVSDSGAGMSDEVRTHLFEPFFTTKPPGKGTGLGLATCYGVVKQAGGDIQAESEPGHGSTFRIFLPRVNQLLPADDGSGDGEMPGGTETVLVVEDERAVRELASRVLRRLGYRVLEAVNGEQALAVAAQHPGRIDLLFTDVVMPQMGGKELAEKFRAVRPATPVLFTSGYTADSVVRDGIMEHAIAFLTKPFSPPMLARKVREVLDEVRAGAGSPGVNA